MAARGATAAEKLLELQRIHGNAFVQRWIQCKLTVNQPGDPYEREADRVAEAVVHMTEGADSNGALDRQEKGDVAIRRMCGKCEEEVRQVMRHREAAALVRRQQGREEEERDLQAEAAPGGVEEVSEQVERSIRSLRGRGRPLPARVRREMEGRMGYDFGPVRIHTDGQANQLTRSVNALAFTHGNDIVFGSGQYRAETDGGKWLLAHELTHVIQQTGAGGFIRGPLSEE